MPSKEKILPTKEQLEISELKARLRTSYFGAFTAFLIPLVIGVATYKFNSTQLEVNSSQNRLSQQQSCIKENLELLDKISKQDNSPDKSEQLGVELAEHGHLLAQICTSVGIQLPSSVNRELARVGRDADNAATRNTAQQALEIQATALTTPDPAQNGGASIGASPSKPNLPARVYFLIPNNNQRMAAQDLANKLEQQTSRGSPILVPRIHTEAGDKKNELTCFEKAECQEAEDIMKVINDLLIEPQFKLVDLSTKEEKPTGIRPRHYELWFSTGPIRFRQ